MLLNKTFRDVRNYNYQKGFLCDAFHHVNNLPIYKDEPKFTLIKTGKMFPFLWYILLINQLNKTY
jgi:hypothetical protein